MKSLLLAATALTLVALPSVARAQEPRPQVFPTYMNFEGRYLAILSDADMVASGYIDGQLGPRGSGLRDELAIIPLAGGMPGTPRRVPVSNAVTAWPSLMALSRDGRFVYVAETDMPPPAGATEMSSLRPSPMVRVIALDGELNGRIVQEIETRGRATAINIRPQGDLMAVNTTGAQRPEIGFLRIGPDGQLSNFVPVPLPGTTTSPGDLKWSPDGSTLAATFPQDNMARFYRVVVSGADIRVEQLGEPIITGKLPGPGHWSPDGRHFFVTNLYWLGGAANLFVGSNVSTIAAIRVDAAQGRHAMVSAAPAGASAEEFAISPDGRTIVTLNMENSFLPPDDRRLSLYSSLTLIHWDPERERLVTRSTTPFEGILPEGINFDASGRFLAVANFAHFNPRRPMAETTVDFWRLVDGPEPRLVQMDVKVPVMRGAHVVKLAQ